MDLVTIWTGRHANALRAALRLTNEGMAQAMGTAVRTIAKWNAEPDLQQSPELQTALDTMLSKASIDERRRFAAIVNSGELAADAITEVGERLAKDPSWNYALSWIDDRAKWKPGTARRHVAKKSIEVDSREVADQARARSQVSREELASFLKQVYNLPHNGYGTFTGVLFDSPLATSVLSHPDWLDLSAPLASDSEVFSLNPGAQLQTSALDDVGAAAACERVALAAALDGRITNSVLYRLMGWNPSPGKIRADFALTDFVTYALTMDLLENETIDAIVSGQKASTASLPLRARYLPDVESVINVDRRTCAGGPLALFAAARPSTRRRPKPDYVLIIQERSGRVLNAAHRLAVIPKAFHQPLVDLSGEVPISCTLEREMEEELFGRPEVDSTSGNVRRADPFHPSRLTEPMRWLAAHPGAWQFELTGVGLNLMSGNFEFASLIVVHDESWWTAFGGHVEANWEADGLRQYSSLGGELVTRLVHDASWSNEGLFAFMEGLRRLREIGGERVDLPQIDWEL